MPAALHCCVGVVVVSMAAGIAPSAQAHGFNSAAITLEHPYVVTKPGSTHAALQFVRIRNAAAEADRLMRVRCAGVAAVSLLRSSPEGRMQGESGIDLPAHAALSLRHEGAMHIVLDCVGHPWAEGDRVQCVASFEHAPDLAFEAHLQTPRTPGAGALPARAAH